MNKKIQFGLFCMCITGVMYMLNFFLIETEVNYKDFEIQKLEVITEENTTSIHIQGILFNSSQGISRISESKSGYSYNITLYQKLALDKYTGNLDYKVELPYSIDSITFGNQNEIIWYK